MSAKESSNQLFDHEKQKAKIRKKNQLNEEIRQNSTGFWKVLLFFFIESFSFLLLLWLLTYPSFKFTCKIKIGLAVSLVIGVFVLIVFSTAVGYFLGFHYNDQFIFNLSFFGAIVAFYISDFWIIRNNLLYMFLFCLGCTVVFLLIGGVLSVLAKNLKLHFKKK